MKIEFELPDEYKNEKLVVCRTNEPSPIIYFNIFEEGDIWIKTKGCEDCSLENRKKCCSSCPMFSDRGCFIHLKKGDNDKPYSCVINPNPGTTLAWCSLEFECIRGSRIGLIKKVNEGSFINRE